MVIKQEAVHIQETKQDPDDEWVKWHLCPRCEALETGQTEADVMEANFKKPMEHKKIRVQRYQEALKKNSQEWEATGGKKSTRSTKKKLLRSNLEEAHNALVQKLKESSSLQEDEELEVGHGLVSAKLVSANVVSANLVSFILFTNRGLSTNRCCVLKSAEEH